MLVNDASERRLVKRMLSYWEGLKSGEGLPRIEEFSQEDISDLWPFCFRVSIGNIGNQDNGDKRRAIYKYEYVGDEVKKAYATDMIGEQVTSAIKNVPGAQVLEKIDKCIETTKPVIEQGNFINNNDEIIKYRGCILPFSKNEDNLVTHAIVGLSWQTF